MPVCCDSPLGLLNAITDAMPVGLLVIDGDERVLEANPAALGMFGRDPSIRGARCGDVIGCANRHSDPGGCGQGRSCPDCPVFGAVRAVLAGGPGFRDREVPMEIEVPGGVRTRWFLTSVTPMEIEGRRLALVALHDVTEHRLSSDEAVWNEARMRSLFAVARHPAADTQQLLDFALHEAIRLTGSRIGFIYHYDEDRKVFTLNSWSREVMAECAVLEPRTVYELDRTGAWGEVVRQRTAVVINDYAAESPLKKGTPQGHVELRRFMSVPVFDQGRIVAVVGVANKDDPYHEADSLQLALMMDTVWKMVKQRGTSEALRLSEERYRLIAENTADIITLLDLSLRTVYVSPSVERVLGFTVEEELARPLVQSLTGGSLRVVERALAEELELERSGAADPNRTRILELEHFHEDGSTVWLEVSLSFIRDGSGRATGILAVSRDVSERKSAQREREQLAERIEASQRLESIGRLAGGVAHDFNNLLTVIISCSGFALAGLPEGGALRADLEEIDRAARRAADLTRQLLAFSRRQVLEPRIMDLNRAADGLRRMLRRLLGEDIEIEIRTAAEPALVLVDPGQIDQVLLNLAVNARDAMPDGGTLAIEIRVGDPGPDGPGEREVVVGVSDTGVGMDEQTRKRVFEPFFTTKELGKGTGLGLSTVYGIISQSGGSIGVRSEVGRGTTFEIRFPLAGAAPVPVPAADSAPPRPAGRETVLVVDDEPAIRTLARRILTDAGFVVLSAAGGTEALEVFEGSAGDIDLLLTDVLMPGTSGRQLALDLARLRPGLRVVFMSGYSEDVLSHQGDRELGIRFLPKPFEAVQLVRKVREVLDAPC
jgi:PAS domain S-box-containing protein